MGIGNQVGQLKSCPGFGSIIEHVKWNIYNLRMFKNLHFWNYKPGEPFKSKATKLFDDNGVELAVLLFLTLLKEDFKKLFDDNSVGMIDCSIISHIVQKTISAALPVTCVVARRSHEGHPSLHLVVVHCSHHRRYLYHQGNERPLAAL